MCTDISCGARFEALDEGVLVAPWVSRYTQVGFNLTSVQVCSMNHLEVLVHQGLPDFYRPTADKSAFFLFTSVEYFKGVTAIKCDSIVSLGIPVGNSRPFKKPVKRIIR